MRHVLTIVVLGALALGTSSAQQQQQLASSEPPIDLPPSLARVLRDYETAWRARDAAALARLFVDEEVVMPNACAPVRGRAGVERCYAGSGGGLSLRAARESPARDASHKLPMKRVSPLSGPGPLIWRTVRPGSTIDRTRPRR